MNHFGVMAPTAIALAAAAPLPADTLTFQQGVDSYTGHRDVQVRNDAANLTQSSNTGTNVTGWTGGATPVILRGLHTWDLSAIPAGATITGVTLTLGNRSDTGVSIDDANNTIDASDPLVDIRTISAPITEPSIANGTSTTSGSNWSNTFGAGMTLGASALSSARFDPEIGGNFATNTFASSAAFVAAVQAAVDSASNQFNFAVLLANESGTDRVAIQMGSNVGNLNGADPTLPPRPILTIDFIPIPEPASLALLALGGVLAFGRRR